MANLQLHVGRQIPVQARFFDAAGLPAVIVGVAEWTTSDATKVAINELADGTCILLGVATDTDVEIEATGTGAGGDPVSATLLVDVISAVATTAEIVVGDEISQAAQAP